MARRMGARALWLAWLCLGAATAAAAAAEEQLVYWPLVTDGAEYRRVPYPEEAGPLLVLADTEVVIEARRAPVSHWPITREYVADLSQATQPPAASLEIVDSSGAVSVVEPEAYVMWHPDGVGVGPAELVRGDAARKLYEDYVRTARASAERIKEYQRIVAEHQALLEAWLRMAAERRGQDMPDPPPELTLEAPEPYRAYASEPREAAIVSLPEGRYTVRLRGADQDIEPGSERELVSFGPLQQGVGYVLRLENRWTQPVASFAPDEVIYTSGGTDLFFQPVPVAKYQAQRLTRLFRPQSVEAADPALTVWVPGEESGAVEGAALALWSGSDLVGTLPRTPYRVAQIPGVSRGYTIEEFAPRAGASLTPDFAAMRVSGETAFTRIGLVEAAGGETLEASERQVRQVTPPAEAMLFLPALLPIAAGVLLRTASTRRRRTSA